MKAAVLRIHSEGLRSGRQMFLLLKQACTTLSAASATTVFLDRSSRPRFCIHQDEFVAVCMSFSGSCLYQKRLMTTKVSSIAYVHHLDNYPKVFRTCNETNKQNLYVIIEIV
ncbi:hypothetical protein HPP92_025935 [Vanilla planifolia]|uniref:Uncharacterized protein n=1 Tax=Vanilla planifolia TaxID=51239 RepID=A0A835PJC2_VANPL|nr:hypothetical protein HPP92_025935 [Vanilla planifolia]